jgi:hypothetical protein
MDNAIPVVGVPGAWDHALRDWDFPDVDAVLAAYFDAGHPVHRLAADRAGDGVGHFISELRAGLDGPARCAAVTYPGEVPAVTASVLVAAALGGVRQTCAAPLAGPVEIDVASTAVRSNAEEGIRLADGSRLQFGNPNPWHTDAAPWYEPARWTVLGMNFCAPAYAGATTDFLPLWHVLDSWPDDPGHLDVLREAAVDWRQLFPAIEPRLAPVLGPSATRWIADLLPAEMAEPGTVVGAACAAFARHVDAMDPLYWGVLGAGRLLVMDNHHAIHRGPVIAEPDLRRICKIKIGGRPER